MAIDLKKGREACEADWCLECGKDRVKYPRCCSDTTKESALAKLKRLHSEAFDRVLEDGQDPAGTGSIHQKPAPSSKPWG